jgi:hypothetical protein
MMNGEKKFLLAALCLSLFCLTVIVSWLFLALWQQRELVAFGLLGLGAFTVIACVTVTVLGHLNEQSLRRQRVLYHSELPLDAAGRPLYLPETMRQAHSYAPPSSQLPQSCQRPRFPGDRHGLPRALS